MDFSSFLHRIIMEVAEILLGKVKLSVYIGAGIFSSLVILANILVISRMKYKKATGTPDKYSFKFAFIDNSKRMVASMILMFLFYRFAPTLSGKELTMEWAVGIGIFMTFGVDKLMGYLKSKFNFFDVIPRTPDQPTSQQNQQP